ncbi:MAG TPA: hypothetical protein VFB22_10780 [Candidatus Baltobacteraceae bacterium]|nr:hypothetical protein [Candidatus Baltobacteraceae bacterium]
MPRFLVVLAVLAYGTVPVVVSAAPSPPPSAKATAVADASARDAGVIEGRVTHVDYARNVISVDSPAQGKVDLSVMPTTSIQGADPGYHAITDVSKGSKVRIFAARIAGKLVAQIIHLVKR